MTNKTHPPAHAEITAPISADLRGIDDAGAQPKQQPEALRLAEILDSYVPPGGSGPISQAAAELRSQYAAITATASAALMRSQRARIAELEALQAAPPAPAAVAMPESHTQALKAIAEWPVTDMLLNMDAANMRGIAQRALAAAPEQAKVSQDHFATAQEHATQLAGQGQEKCVCTFAQRVVGDGCRHCNPQEYIDRLHKCLDEYREEAAAPAQAQEDARDEWEGIASLPNCDDLIWLYCQDTNTTDGPVTPCPAYADSWTHWAFAEAPSTKSIDAARAAQGGAA